MALIVNGKKVNIKGIETFCHYGHWKNYAIKEILEKKYSKMIKRDVWKYNKDIILSNIKRFILKEIEESKHLDLNEYNIKIIIGYRYSFDFEKNLVMINVMYVLCQILYNGIAIEYTFNVLNDEFEYELDDKTKKDIIIVKTLNNL